MRPHEFPEHEPDTQRDLPVAGAHDSAPPPRSTWRPRARMPSASYSIVPGRTPYESGVAPIEVAAVPAPGEPPPEDDVSHWQVDLMLARLPRITHNALLEVDDSASSELVNQRYHALVRQVDGWRVSESPTLRRKIAIVLDALAEAYETLSAAARRREGLARLRENGR